MTILKLRREVIKLTCGKCDKKEKKEEDLGKPIGTITHYYSKIGVGIIELKDAVKVGEKIKIKGHSTDIEQGIDSMQIEHQNVQTAKAGDSVGLKMEQKIKENDQVFKATE